MQTFLPYADFAQSAFCLDNKRLGKQRVECLQILTAIDDGSYGWQNHPAVNMWRPYSYSLLQYSKIICLEWISRGYNDSILNKLNHLEYIDTGNPYWLGYESFHESHQSNLLRKLPEHYSKFNWQVQDNLPYVWPR